MSGHSSNAFAFI